MEGFGFLKRNFIFIAWTCERGSYHFFGLVFIGGDCFKTLKGGREGDKFGGGEVGAGGGCRVITTLGTFFPLESVLFEGDFMKPVAGFLADDTGGRR